MANNKTHVIKVDAIVANRPTANGRVYPKEVLEKAIENYAKRESHLPVTAIRSLVEPILNPDAAEIDIDLIPEGNDVFSFLDDRVSVGVVEDVALKNDRFEVKVRLIDNDLLKIGKLYPTGVGGISDDNVIVNYELIGFDLFP